MHKKVIFLDIDGTLVGHDGVIPESAKEAIVKARANGHLVFICTGRSLAQIPKYILEAGLDGVIGAAGGYVEIAGQTIRKTHIPADLLDKLIKYFDEKQIHFYLESNSGVYGSKGVKKAFIDILDRIQQEKATDDTSNNAGVMQFVYNIHDDVSLMREDINKVSFLGSDVPLEEIATYFKDDFVVLPTSVKIKGKNAGELMLMGVHKASGIEMALETLGMDKKDAFAYGDSYNDLEMVEYVQYGIAMGNACEALKKVAFDVTDDVDQDGLYNSFKKYGLI